MLVTAGLPVRLGGGQVQPLAAHLAAGGLHCGHGAAQAHIECGHTTVVHPAAGVQRQGLAAPAVQVGQGLGLRQLEAQRGLGRGHGQHLEADFGDAAKRAPGARQQARHVVAGHVLHHLAAEAQCKPLPIEHGGAQHEVTHGPHLGPRRAAEAGRHHAAHGATWRQPGRLERQALALRSQGGLQLRQRRAAAGGDHQFTGLIGGNAAVASGVQRLALQLLAVKILGASAQDTQGPALGGGGADLVGKGVKGCIHSLHGSGSLCTCRPRRM